MKNTYSEKYYRDNWDRFLSDRKTMNLEGDMEMLLKRYIEAGMSEQAVEILKPAEAKKVFDRAMSQVKEMAHSIKEIEAGRASLGMISRRQEIEERHNLRQRFEFTCLQIADFKKKYNI